MTGCIPVHGNIQNATAKAWRASSELGYDKIVTKSGALGCQPDKHDIQLYDIQLYDIQLYDIQLYDIQLYDIQR
jgi:hypothetical protein